MVKIKILIKSELKSAWGTSIFLVVGAVFSQVVDCLSIDVVMSRAFKDFIRLFN